MRGPAARLRQVGVAVADTARAIGVRRSCLTLALLVCALLVARYSWQMRLVADAERAMYDLRVWVAMEGVEQDPRIVLVTYTDDTLELTGRRSPLDRGILARALARLDTLGAKSIGIDILVDQPQPEDAALQAALSAMRTPTYLAFANATTNAGSVQFWQEQFQRQFQGAITSPAFAPASVRLEADLDGVIRSWPRRPPGDPSILTDRMAGAGHTIFGPESSIDFREPEIPGQPIFASLPIELFEDAATVEALRSTIAGRYVLIGGDISDVDQFDTPATRMTGQTTTGLVVHAHMLAQKLDGEGGGPLGPVTLWFLAIVIIGMAAVHGYGDFGPWNIVVLVLELVILIVIPFAREKLGYDSQTIPAFGWIVGWVLAYSAAAAAARGVGSDQRKFAQSALGRYLPPEVAKAILKDPKQLNLTGERRTIYALFSDIEGFTALTHAIEPEATATFLNAYLDRMSNIVLEHGGTIDKFVGDAVVAFWGAPIARPDDGAQALRCALAIAQAGDEISAAMPPDGPRIGRTRVGVHRGEAIVGNFGGEDRIQYTALGDVMNTAARLEGANKSMKTHVLVSSAAAEGVTGLPLRPMGRVTVRGRSTAFAVMDMDARVTAAERARITSLIAAFDQGSAGAVEALDAYCAAQGDPAIVHLVYRLKRAGPGGSYALD